MKHGRLQAKDVPDEPILAFLAKVQRGETFWTPAPDQERGWGSKPIPHSAATWFAGVENSVQHAMPPDTPAKLALAKMASMIRRGLITGCACGCRGDFALAENTPPPPKSV